MLRNLHTNTRARTHLSGRRPVWKARPLLQHHLQTPRQISSTGITFLGIIVYNTVMREMPHLTRADCRAVPSGRGHGAEQKGSPVRSAVPVSAPRSGSAKSPQAAAPAARDFASDLNWGATQPSATRGTRRQPPVKNWRFFPPLRGETINSICHKNPG